MARKLTVDEVCELLHINRSHLNQLHYRSEGPPRIQVTPRKFLYDAESLEQWLMSREERQSA